MFRYSLLVLLLILSFSAGAQSRFTAVDRKARTTGYAELSVLAQQLTAGYSDEEDKVRSNFVWITAHIAYDEQEFRQSDPDRYGAFTPSSEDSMLWKEDWERHLATYALKDHMAVCEGYASLLTVLCKEAGISAYVVKGYARNYTDVGKPYTENHAWNAVKVNGKWQLMDATWAGGGLDKKAIKLHPQFNSHYFQTPPERMAIDHYPLETRWLLGVKLSREAFVAAPYLIPDHTWELADYFPKRGVLSAKEGDSIVFILKTSQELKKIRLWEEETDRWLMYESEEKPATTPVAGKLPAASGPSSATRKALPVKPQKPDPALDAILGYADTVTAAPDNERPQAAPPPGKSEISPAQGEWLRFTRNPDRIRLVYKVKGQGRRHLWLYAGDDLLLIYINDTKPH